MRYCSDCGEPVRLMVPEGDNRPRFVCPSCSTIHYQNPNIVTGCIVEAEDKILLCKRAIEPRYGLWTLPAGFMENNETAQQGAARETMEEAGAETSVGELYSCFNLPHISQVYLLFRATLAQPGFSAGSESLQVALFSENEIPWNELAFPVIEETLKLYFSDQKKGDFKAHSGTIKRISSDTREYHTEINY
ncbi:MAG: NUDIX hydrolase [gamma proteobacterium symbiont of Bathyaustriella thionipta]|nr:NUDIX hydrolase [gamma proteobacterium symbiont of Bathyaustriella thionipta]